MAESSPNGQKTLWEKEKIAHYKQFLLLLVPQTHKNQGLFGKGLKYILHLYELCSDIGDLNLYHTIPSHNDPRKGSFGKHRE